jgi:hypothetical protein
MPSVENLKTGENMEQWVLEKDKRGDRSWVFCTPAGQGNLQNALTTCVGPIQQGIARDLLNTKRKSD